MSQIQLQFEIRQRLVGLGVAWAENVLVHPDDLGKPTGSVSIPTDRGTYVISINELELLNLMRQCEEALSCAELRPPSEQKVVT